jgi:5'-nucleotidase
MAVALVLLSATAATAQVEVLLTNDDGVDAIGIQAVFDALSGVSGINVTVVAPAANASGTGFGFDTTFPGGVLHVDTAALMNDGVTTAFAVSRESEDVTETLTQEESASPGDCVRWALNQLYTDGDRETMIVVSGSNRGQNYGLGLPASGTVGAAGTAKLLGVKRAIAVSQGLSVTNDLIGVSISEFTAGAQFVANLVQAMVNGDTSVKKFEKNFEKGAFLNINVPPAIPPAPPLAGALVTKFLADFPIITTYTEGATVGTVTDYSIDFDLNSVETLGPEAMAFKTKTDVGAVAQSFISVQSLFLARLPKGGGKVDPSLLTGVTP